MVILTHRNIYDDPVSCVPSPTILAGATAQLLTVRALALAWGATPFGVA